MFKCVGFRVILTLVLSILTVPLTTAQVCDQSVKFYESNGYEVNAVRAKAPLKGLLGTFRKSLSEYLKSKDVTKQAGFPFKESTADKVGTDLKKQINEDRPMGSVPLQVQIGLYAIENCDSRTKKLDIVYKFYLFQPAYYFSRTFELGKNNQVEGDRPPKEKDDSIKKVEVQPFLGYDNSRRFYGGTKVKLEIENPVLQNLEFEVSGSTRSREIKVELSGGKDSDTNVVRYQTWQLNYQNKNAPANRTKLRESIGSAQYYASTRAYSKNEFILRFGGRFEGGNLQSDATLDDTNSDIFQNSRVISGKGFVGTSFNVNQHQFKASYGLQVSGIKQGKTIDYVKQVVDTAASFNFSSFTAETQFAAGNLSILGNVPVADRFFGGNKSKNFINSDDWIIQSNPLIRSFAVNKLSSPDGSNSRGGNRFLAFNFTLSVGLWRKPLIEKAIWENPNRKGEFRDEIIVAEATAFEAAEIKLTNEYLRNLPQFKAFPGFVKQMDDKLTEISAELKKVPRPNQNLDIEKILDELFDPESPFKIEVAETTVARIKDDYANGNSIANDVEALVRPSSDPDLADEKTIIQDLNERLLKLSNELRNQSENNPATKLSEGANFLEGLSKQMLAVYSEIENSPQTPLARQKAQRDLVYPRQLLRFFIRDSDWISVNPVFIFDAVKLNQNDLPINSWRFGAGGGIKFRFIFLDITSGYVWNLRRKQGEKSGEILFKFDMASLFK